MVAVDVGYGLVKAVRDDRRVAWASTAQPGRASAYAALGPADGHSVVVRRPGGEPEAWRLGDPRGPRAWADVAAAREGYPVHVLAACAALGVAGDVSLAVGLPLALWAQPEQRRALRDSLAGLRAEVSIDGGPVAPMAVADVRVLPQAAGAFAAALRADPELASRPCGLIDVGYRTTDYLVMRRAAAGLAPDDAACGSADLGIGQVYERVRAALEAEAGALVPEGAVEEALEHYGGRMWLRGREVDVAAMVRREAAALAAEVAAAVRRAWGDRLALLGAVLLAGGGGEALAPHLADLHPLLRLVPDPVWANARGFLVMVGAAGTA
jgi:plasmid segregation protein ParM